MQAVSHFSSKASVADVSALRARQTPAFSRARVSCTIENRVAIRFQRYGRHKTPFYRLVALDSKRARDCGAPLEYLGWYDPIRKETNLNSASIKKWLSEGAKPSDTVRDLLKKASIIELGDARFDSRRPSLLELKKRQEMRKQQQKKE